MPKLSALASAGPGAHGEFAERQVRPIVHAVDGLHREFLEQAFSYHHAAAGDVLLGGLKDEMHGAVEIAGLGEVARGAEQHGGVAIVTAAVEFAGNAGAVREIVEFLHRQRVHVGAQPDGGAVAALQRPHHAGFGEALVHVDAPAAHPLGDESGGAALLDAVSGCAWRSRRHAVISSWKDAMRLMICMGVDIAWWPHERQGPAVHAEDKPLFKLFHLDECPTNPMEPGRGEQIKLINPSLGTEKVDVHLNRLVPGGPRGKHHHHSNADNVYIVKRGEGTLTIEDKPTRCARMT